MNQETLEHLLAQCRSSYRNFHAHHWQCEAVNNQASSTSSQSGPRAIRGFRSKPAIRCVNFRDGHQKGHQFVNPSRRSVPRLQLGNFESSFDEDALIEHLTNEIILCKQSRDFNSVRTGLRESATAIGLDMHKSNITCLVCLSRMPVHTLQCGHLFCSICLQRLNENPDSSEPHLIHLGSCPLHDDRSCQNVVLRLKPANAGARTLALDG
jgi:hypothetical protein